MSNPARSHSAWDQVSSGLRKLSTGQNHLPQPKQAEAQESWAERAAPHSWFPLSFQSLLAKAEKALRVRELQPPAVIFRMFAVKSNTVHYVEMVAQLKQQVQQKFAFMISVKEMAKNFKAFFPINKDTLPFMSSTTELYNW
uniref:Uncharacterized protein n=1 Tax=Sphaerodactylus townsendi TaxID=933632 RepID=A0ACB8F6I0_9SAUR